MQEGLELYQYVCDISSSEAEVMPTSPRRGGCEVHPWALRISIQKAAVHSELQASYTQD